MIEVAVEFFRMLLDPRLYWGASHILTDFSRTTAAMLLTSLWQGLVIAAFLALCLRFTPRISAGLRFALLTAGFAAVVALPFLAVLPGFIAGTQGAAETGAAHAASHPWLVMDGRWSVAFTLVWLAMSLWRAVLLAGDAARLRRLWTSAVPVVGHGLALPKLKSRTPVELCSTEALDRPSVIGFFAPRILIPAWLLERMDTTDLEQIVLHESEHLRRGDDWTNLLQKLALVIFPLSPALLWMERRLCLEREMACDEGVVRRTRSPRAYAICLTTLAEHGLTRRVQALSLGAWHKRSELARRVESLLARKPALRPAAAGGLALVLGAGLVGGSAELARCPQLIGFAAPAEHNRVPAAQETAAIAPGSVLEGDRVFRTGIEAGAQAKATELRSVLPQRHFSLVPAYHATRRNDPRPARNGASAAKEEDAAVAFPVPTIPASAREQMARYDVSGATADSGEAEGWLVMTTWEQTIAPAATTGDTANANDPSQATHAGPRAAQMVVTRLVWRVAPARAVSGAGDDAGDTLQAPAQRPAQTQSARPAIVPVRGGWLIFRL